jgi:hypothetical protein
LLHFKTIVEELNCDPLVDDTIVPYYLVQRHCWLLCFQHPNRHWVIKMAPPQKEKKLKKGKPPPIDKLLVPAIGIAIAIVAFQFVKGILRAEVSQ